MSFFLEMVPKSQKQRILERETAKFFDYPRGLGEEIISTFSSLEAVTRDDAAIEYVPSSRKYFKWIIPKKMLLIPIDSEEDLKNIAYIRNEIENSKLIMEYFHSLCQKYVHGIKEAHLAVLIVGIPRAEFFYKKHSEPTKAQLYSCSMFKQHEIARVLKYKKPPTRKAKSTV